MLVHIPEEQKRRKNFLVHLPDPNAGSYLNIDKHILSYSPNTTTERTE